MELTERQRAIVEAFVLEGLTYRQVAERFGIAPGTVNPILKYSARKLGTDRISREALRPLLLESIL